MGAGEVHDVEVVAERGAIGGVVVVAEDGELLSDALGGLGDVWEEVLRFALR